MSNFRVPYVVGNKFHVDHGIWPVRTAIHLFKLFGGIGDEQSDEYKRFLRGLELDHPIGLTLDQLQLLTWRVSEWTVAGSSWTFTALAEDIPVVDTDDYAILHDSGSIPEFKFKIQRLNPTPSSVVRDVTDERDLLAEWRNHKLTGDSRHFEGPPRDVDLWKTLRNYGVQGAEGEAGNGSPDPANITDNFYFSDPVVLVGPPRTFNPLKFAPPFGSATGGVLALHILNDYVVYNPTLELFFPNIFFAFGGTALPQFRLGRRVAVFNLLPAVPVGTPPVNPDIPVGSLVINFGGTGVPSVTVPIGIIQGARGRDTPHTGLTPLTLEPWSVQNTLEGSFDLVMNATKFRQFRNSLDQPCFNETSGVQVNKPHA